MRIKNLNKINCLLLGLFVISVIFSRFKVFSIISLIGFLIFLLNIIKEDALFYIKYFYIVFVVLATIFACFVIEFGNFFLLEVREFAKYTGSLPLLILSYFTLIVTINYLDKKYNKKTVKKSFVLSDKSEQLSFRYISIFTLLLIFLCFIKVLPHPSFVIGLERADYAIQYGLSGIFGKMSQNIPRLIIFPFVLTIGGKGKDRFIGLSCLILSILYYLWVGNKFGAFFEMMCIFLIVLADYLVVRFSTRKIISFISKIAIAFVILICVTLLIQSFTYNGTIMTYFSSRIAAEGQVWWRVFDLSTGKFHLNEILDELQSFKLGTKDVRESLNAHYGIYKMMYYIAPESYVSSLISAGYRYTEAGFAIMFYYFSYMGPLIYAIIMGIYFTFITNRLFIAINKRQVLRVYLYIRLWLYGTTSFSMFIFSPFFTPMSVAIYVYLLLTHNKNLTVNIKNVKVKL